MAVSSCLTTETGKQSVLKATTQNHCGQWTQGPETVLKLVILGCKVFFEQCGRQVKSIFCENYNVGPPSYKLVYNPIQL